VCVSADLRYFVTAARDKNVTTNKFEKYDLLSKRTDTSCDDITTKPLISRFEVPLKCSAREVRKGIDFGDRSVRFETLRFHRSNIHVPAADVCYPTPQRESNDAIIFEYRKALERDFRLSTSVVVFDSVRRCATRFFARGSTTHEWCRHIAFIRTSLKRRGRYEIVSAEQYRTIFVAIVSPRAVRAVNV